MCEWLSWPVLPRVYLIGSWKGNRTWGRFLWFVVAFSRLHFHFRVFFVHSGPGDSSYGLLLPFDVLSSCSCFVLSGPGDSSFVLSLHVLVLFRVNVFFSSSSCGLLLMRLYPDAIIPFLGQITFWVI